MYLDVTTALRENKQYIHNIRKLSHVWHWFNVQVQNESTLFGKNIMNCKDGVVRENVKHRTEGKKNK